MEYRGIRGTTLYSGVRLLGSGQQGERLSPFVYTGLAMIRPRELAEKVGIPQRHISEMENGKRVIGEEMALRLGKILRADYRVLL